MNLEMLQSLHMIFYIILAFAVLAGFVRGFKKSLYTLVTMVIFYAFFFITLDAMVQRLWVMEMPWLGGMLGNYLDPALSGFVSFDTSLESFLQIFLGDTVTVDSSNAELMALATGLGQFVLKIVYTMLYFTVFLLIYKIIVWIIGLIVIRKREGAEKNRLFGAIVGVANGVLAIFITLIMLGGIVNVAKNATTIMASLESDDTESLSLTSRHELENLDYDLLSEPVPLSEPTASDEAIDDLNTIITQYENNLFVKIAESVTTTSRIDDETDVPLHIDLFDAVMSFEQDSEVIALRYELGVLSEAGTIILESEFMDTNDIMDLTGSEIESVFTILAESKLITTNAPLMIELAVDHYDVDLPVDRTVLYENINYETELPAVGNIVGSLFDILNNAGLLDGSSGTSDITVEPQDIRDLFSSIPDSDLTMIMIEAVAIPMIENSETGFLAMIAIPANVIWEEEIVAIGELLASIAEQDVALDDISSGDIMTVLNAFADIDTDTLLGSKLLNETLIEILKGNAGIEGVEFLSVPTGIEWYDTYDGTTLTEAGELRHLMEAFKALVADISDLDFESLSLEDVASISETTIDRLTDSRIISATVSDVIMTSDLGGTSIIIPDDLIDTQGFIVASELNALLKSVTMVLSGGSFDVDTVLTMTETDIDTFLGSDIIAATIGKLIADISSGVTVPDEVMTSVTVDGSGTDVVNDTEIKNLLLAAQVLDVTDFEGFAFDVSILDALENTGGTALDETKIDALLASGIIHASISGMLIDLDDSSGVIVVPSEHPDSTVLLDETGSVPLIDADEINDVLQAIYVLDLTSLDNIDLQDISTFSDHMSMFLESSIIQATISDVMLTTVTGDLVIPEATLTDTSDATYVSAGELQALVDAMDEIGLTDLTSVSMTPSDLFAADGTIVFASEIIQATVSDYILSVALTEDEPYDDASLIVPNQERLAITVDGSAAEMIRSDEITAILDALETFGMTSSFADDITSSAVTDMDETELTVIMASDSFHVTADAMINDALIVPDFVKEDVAGVSGVASSQAIINMVIATQRFSTSSNISNITFDYATLAGMDQADADVVLDSAIVRATLTPDVEALPTTSPVATDYDDAAMTTLKKTYIMDVLGY